MLPAIWTKGAGCAAGGAALSSAGQASRFWAKAATGTRGWKMFRFLPLILFLSSLLFFFLFHLFFPLFFPAKIKALVNVFSLGSVTCLWSRATCVSPYSLQNLCEKGKSGVQWWSRQRSVQIRRGWFVGWIFFFFFWSSFSEAK